MADSPEEKYFKIENVYFDGDDTDGRQIDVDSEAGISAIYCPLSQKISAYLFEKELWTEEDAALWVDENAAKDVSMEVSAAIIERSDKGMLAVASTDVEDRDGEVISMEGWDLKAFKKNPVLLWMHNRSTAHDGLPIGKAEDIRVRTIEGRKLLTFRPEYDDSTEFNRAVKKMVDNGLLNAFSVGFLPKDKDGNMYTKVELLEISQVPVPANSEAMFIQRGKALGFSVDKLNEFVDIKAVVGFEGYEAAPESRGWDAAVARSRIRDWAVSKDGVDMAKYQQAFTWYDAENKGNVGAYKLPHHDIENGKIVTVWRGVVAAMAVIMGARGAVGIPESDLRSVYNHLAQHYKQFDKEAPDFKMVEGQSLREMFSIVKEMESKRTFSQISQTLKEVKEIRREMKKQKSNFESERAVALILKGISANITPLLKGNTSLKKGGLSK